MPLPPPPFPPVVPPGASTAERRRLLAEHDARVAQWLAGAQASAFLLRLVSAVMILLLVVVLFAIGGRP